jgi:hypothetical protein
MEVVDSLTGTEVCSKGDSTLMWVWPSRADSAIPDTTSESRQEADRLICFKPSILIFRIVQKNHVLLILIYVF